MEFAFLLFFFFLHLKKEKKTLSGYQWHILSRSCVKSSLLLKDYRAFKISSTLCSSPLGLQIHPLSTFSRWTFSVEDSPAQRWNPGGTGLACKIFCVVTVPWACKSLFFTRKRRRRKTMALQGEVAVDTVRVHEKGNTERGLAKIRVLMIHTALFNASESSKMIS